jgi:hypothetical protein
MLPPGICPPCGPGFYARDRSSWLQAEQPATPTRQQRHGRKVKVDPLPAHPSKHTVKRRFHNRSSRVAKTRSAAGGLQEKGGGNSPPPLPVRRPSVRSDDVAEQEALA